VSTATSDVETTVDLDDGATSTLTPISRPEVAPKRPASTVG
jgi:hypothetical protein